MFLPDVILQKLRKKYKSNSVTTINNNIKRIFEDGLHIKTFKKNILLTKFDEIKKYISGLKISVQKSMVHNIRSIVGKKHVGYNNLVIFYNKKHNKEIRYAIPSKKLKDLYMTLEDIGKKVLNYDMKNRGNAVKMMVTSLYRYLPPLRGQDFYNTIVVKVPKGTKYDTYYKKTKNNFVDINKWILVIGDYKTMKIYGLRKINLPDILPDIIKRWMEISNVKVGDHLLKNKMNKKFRQDAFTKLLWRIYGNNFGVDMIRKIYISEMINYLDTLSSTVETIKWRKRMAYMVGHSLVAQEFLYSNFKKLKGKKSSHAYMKKVYGYLKEAYM